MTTAFLLTLLAIIGGDGQLDIPPSGINHWGYTKSGFDLNLNSRVEILDYMLFEDLLLPTVYCFPAEDIHDGLNPSSPQGTITQSGDLDTSGMALGDLVVFDFYFEEIPFVFAGFEFDIHFPPGVLALSEENADWDLGVGAVVSPGAFISGHYLQLPADNQGHPTASTVDNENGKVRIGLLWTSTNDRPVGTPELPNPGGAIVRMAFELIQLPDNLENQVWVYLTFDDDSLDPNADIFANEQALREFISPNSVGVHFGSP